MSKLAILIQCHKNAEQVNMLLNQLENPQIEIFVHVDKKSNIGSQLIRRPDIHFLPKNLRVDVQWARFSQVQATLNLIEYARSEGRYSHYWLISGQDYPIKPIQYIVDYIERDSEANYVELWKSQNFGGTFNHLDKRTSIYFPDWAQGGEFSHRVLRRLINDISGGYNRTFSIFHRKSLKNIRFYFGSCWVCLSEALVNWMEAYLDDHPEYIAFYKHANCPDESFFQTLLMNSPYRDHKKDYLHYVDWCGGGSNPKVLTIGDYDKLNNSEKLIARKFDTDVDEKIIVMIKNEILDIEL